VAGLRDPGRYIALSREHGQPGAPDCEARQIVIDFRLSQAPLRFGYFERRPQSRLISRARLLDCRSSGGSSHRRCLRQLNSAIVSSERLRPARSEIDQYLLIPSALGIQSRSLRSFASTDAGEVEYRECDSKAGCPILNVWSKAVGAAE
jgi:hypothetical protein